MSRSLNDLRPEFREPFERVLREFAAVTGRQLLTTSTLRTLKDQARLFRQGHTTGEVHVKAQQLRDRGHDSLAQILLDLGPIPNGPRVTRAGPGESWHNWRLAADVVPLVNGHAVWDDPSLWRVYGELVINAGLDWGGRFGDKPHCQIERGHPLDRFSENDVQELLNVSAMAGAV